MGELSALACALLWASSTIALRSQSDRVNVLALNAIRSGVASAIFAAVFLASGPADRFLDVPIPALGFLLASVVVGLALGDTLYFRSMHLIGVSRAMPISASYPLLTTLIAAPLLGESIGARTLIGVVAVIGGVYLVAAPPPSTDKSVATPGAGLGVILALAASVCWSFSTILMKPALADIDAIVANAVRLPVGTLVLGLIGYRHLASARLNLRYRRAMLIVLVAGIFTSASSLFYLYAVGLAGAARAATLSAVAPVFAAPLSVIFLSERLSARVGVGTVLTVLGIWLVV